MLGLTKHRLRRLRCSPPRGRQKSGSDFGFFALMTAIAHGLFQVAKYVYAHQASLLYTNDTGRSGVIATLLLLPIVFPMQSAWLREKVSTAYSTSIAPDAFFFRSPLANRRPTFMFSRFGRETEGTCAGLEVKEGPSRQEGEERRATKYWSCHPSEEGNRSSIVSGGRQLPRQSERVGQKRTPPCVARTTA